ncbi:site-specific integrase [Thermoleophilia bacterium SCSIO 60948]|nr:site-specific integrase [Thermoleophilia bacterium SCSIO 60948]
MSRPATGQVVVRERRRGKVYALRFRAYGKRRYVTLGATPAGWTQRLAEEELANVLADVRRGIWRPPVAEPAPAALAEPNFHEFSSSWYARRELEGLRPRSLEYLKWALSDHLLPHLKDHLLSEITIQEVDRYAAAKVAEGRLSHDSINKTLSVLASVLELAVEYEIIVSNPARGRRRRLPAQAPHRAYLEPGQVLALLDAAAALDSEDRARRRYRAAALATLGFAGLRVGELLALRWRDVDLANGAIQVRQSKTSAGVRRVDIQPELREYLVVWKAETGFAGNDDRVFPTGTGNPENRSNLRRRVLLRAVAKANEALPAGAPERLPERLSPHVLRRSFASFLIAEGEDVAYVMGQLGHTDPKMTLGLYAKALRSKRRRSSFTLAEAADVEAVEPGSAGSAFA